MQTEEKKPEIIVFAGPKGSWKSTISKLAQANVSSNYDLTSVSDTLTDQTVLINRPTDIKEFALTTPKKHS